MMAETAQKTTENPKGSQKKDKPPLVSMRG